MRSPLRTHGCRPSSTPPSTASITIDDHGIIQSCNPVVVGIFGYPQAELEGNNVSMLMPDPDRTNHGEYLTNYTSGGAAKIIGTGREIEGLCRDGTVFPLDLAISKVEGQDQRLFVGVVRDISQRKIAEQALVESDESFRSVVETMGDGLMVAVDGQRAFVNQAFMDIDGYKKQEEARNAPRFAGMSPDDRDRILASPRGSRSDRVQLVRPDGVNIASST